MSNRLNQEREKELQPKRMATAKLAIENWGYEIILQDETKLEFKYKGCIIQFFPYSGWATGVTIKDGRGLVHLIEQIKH